MERRQHLTLEQHPDLNSKDASNYLVTEARNTIRYRIGQFLNEKEVDDLKNSRIEYTVKAVRVR